MTVRCDVAGCPREGTNELPVKIIDQETRQLVPATAHLCDRDFRAIHDAAASYALGQGEEDW